MTDTATSLPQRIAACLALVATLISCGKSSDHPMLPQGFLDTPPNGASVQKITPVMGWAVSEDGIDTVGIYLDRRYVMNAKTGLSRPDVKPNYPEIADAENSGWEADLKLDGVPPGAHTIAASIRSKNGATTTLSTRINVQQ